jgi:HEAT repeat protein
MTVNITEDISIRGRVMAALTRMDDAERRVAIRRLRNENRRATFEACVDILDSPDEAVRISAAKVLPIVGATPELAETLVNRLRHHPTPQVRSACAQILAKAELPEAADAVLAALDDPDDEVVKAACDYLARWGSRPAIEALLQTLCHHSWDVRLRACTALMDLDICNARVLMTVEELSTEPEAVDHDADVAARDSELEDNGGLMPPRERVGSMSEIVDRAKRIHMRTVRLAA